jgi:hypothetical protein
MNAAAMAALVKFVNLGIVILAVKTQRVGAAKAKMELNAMKAAFAGMKASKPGMGLAGKVCLILQSSHLYGQAR